MSAVASISQSVAQSVAQGVYGNARWRVEKLFTDRQGLLPKSDPAFTYQDTALTTGAYQSQAAGALLNQAAGEVWRYGEELANAANLDKREGTGGTVTRSNGILMFANAASGLSTAVSELITGLTVGAQYEFTGRMRLVSGANLSIQLRDGSGGGGTEVLYPTVVNSNHFERRRARWTATTQSIFLTYRADNGSVFEVDESAHSFREVSLPDPTETWPDGEIRCPELVKNGNFANGLTDWAVDAVTGTTVEAVAGGVKMTKLSTSAGNAVIRQPLSGHKIGEWVEVSAKLAEAANGGSFIVRLEGASGTKTVFGYTTTLGRHRAAVQIEAGYDQDLRMDSGGTPANEPTITVTDISVRPLGLAASQATTAAKPTLAREPKRGRVNLLTWTDDLTNAAWIKGGASVVADKLIEDTSTGAHYLYQSITFTSADHTFAIDAKAAERTRVQVYIRENFGSGTVYAGGSFDLASGAVVSTIAGTLSITDQGDGWYRLSMAGAPVAGVRTVTVRLEDASGSVSYAGDGSSGVHLREPQPELGTTPTPYQRVRDQFDVYEAGQPHLWFPRFGGDDWWDLGVERIDGTGLFCGPGEQFMVAVAFRATGASKGYLISRAISGMSTERTFGILTDNSSIAFGLRGSELGGNTLATLPGGWNVAVLNWDGVNATVLVNSLSEVPLFVGTNQEEEGAQIVVGARTASSPAVFFNGDLMPPIIRPQSYPLAVRQRLMRTLAAQYNVELSA